MPCDPEDSLGVRALYLYQGEVDTLFRINGTNQPQSIGKAVSSGSIRLVNSDIADLYNRVSISAKIADLPVMLPHRELMRSERQPSLGLGPVRNIRPPVSLYLELGQLAEARGNNGNFSCEAEGFWLVGPMASIAKRLTAYMRVVLAVAFICSSFSYSMPIAEASFGAKIAAIASLEHDHSAGSEWAISNLKASESGVDDKDCIPYGKSHNGHGTWFSDCCAAACFDLTILSADGDRGAVLPPALSNELRYLVRAVGPYRLLRPPRA